MYPDRDTLGNVPRSGYITAPDQSIVESGVTEGWKTLPVFFLLKRGVHAHSCIMGNQGKMVENLKICIGIQSQLVLPEFIYLMLSL